MLNRIWSWTFFLLGITLNTYAAGQKSHEEGVSGQRAMTFYSGPYIALALNPVYLSASQLQLYNGHNGAILEPAIPTFDRSIASFGAALGYSLVASNIPARIELEYFYIPKFHVDFNPVFLSDNQALNPARINSTVSTNTFFINGIYDFVNDSRYLPYITGGIGYTHTATDTTVANKADLTNLNLYSESYSNSSTGVAWNAGLGMRVKVKSRLYFDLLYRFMRLGSIDWGYLSYPHNPGGLDSFGLQANQVYANMLSLRGSWQF